jgi:5-methylcytosine-specific restriction endonuclease McrA
MSGVEHKEYCKAYYAEHKEESYNRVKKWRDSHPGKANEYARNWKKNHPDKVKAASLRYTLEHKEELRIYGLKYRKNHPEYDSEWRAKNPASVKAKAATRMGRKRGLVGVHTTVDINAILVAQNNLCYYCGEPLESYHVDHKQPVSRGGSNWPENLCCTCAHCNLSKGNKTEAEYLARMI